MKAVIKVAALSILLMMSGMTCMAQEAGAPEVAPATTKDAIAPDAAPASTKEAALPEAAAANTTEAGLPGAAAANTTDVEPTPELRTRLCKQVWQNIAENYIDESKLNNWDKVGTKCSATFNTDEELDTALVEIVESVGDRWTKYQSRPIIRAHQKMKADGLVQAGLLLRRHDDDLWHIDSIAWGSPAHVSLLKEGDVILSVNGQRLTKKMGQVDVWDLFVGKPGEKVKVKAVIDMQEKEIELTLYPHSDEQVSMRILPDDVLYIRLPTFEQPNVVRDFLTQLRSVYFQKKGAITGIVFDLRNNPGGIFDMALLVSSVFIESGTLVKATVHKALNETTTEHKVRAMPPFAKRLVTEEHQLDYLKWVQNTPMVVLINGSSASCSEITAGALQDNKRATVIGTRSFGKSVGFAMEQLPNGGVLTVTSLKYLTPAGHDVVDKGITPDLVVDMPRGGTLDLPLKAAHAHVVDAANKRFAQVQDTREIAGKSKDELDETVVHNGANGWTQTDIINALENMLAAIGALVLLVAFSLFVLSMRR